MELGGYRLSKQAKMMLITKEINRQETLTGRAKAIQRHNNKILKELILKKIIRSNIKNFTRSQLRNTVKDILRSFESLNNILFDCNEAFIVDLDVYIKNNLRRIEEGNTSLGKDRKLEVLNKFRKVLLHQQKLIADYETIDFAIKSKKDKVQELLRVKSKKNQEATNFSKEIMKMIEARKSRKMSKMASNNGPEKPVKSFFPIPQKKIQEARHRSTVDLSALVSRRSRALPPGAIRNMGRGSVLNPIHIKMALKNNIGNEIQEATEEITKLEAEVERLKGHREQCRALVDKNFQFLFSRPSIIHEIKFKLVDLICLKLVVEKLEKRHVDKDSYFKGKQQELEKLIRENHEEIVGMIGEDFSFEEKEYLISIAKINLMWKDTIKSDKQLFHRKTTLGMTVKRFQGKTTMSTSKSTNKKPIFRTKSLQVSQLSNSRI